MPKQPSKITPGLVLYNCGPNGYIVMVLGTIKGHQSVIDEYTSTADYPGEFTWRHARRTAVEIAKEHGLTAKDVSRDSDIELEELL